MVDVSIPPPKDSSWQENLRFYCQTSEYDNPSLPFMVSMWSYAIAHNGLTGKQAASAEAYIQHALKQHGLSFDGGDNDGNK